MDEIFYYDLLFIILFRVMCMMVFTLGEKIKSKRKERNMTLKDLAGDRITPGQISLVESGKSNPSIDLLEYLAEKLNTEVEYFLESEEKQATRICEFYVNIAESSVISGDVTRAEGAIEKGLFFSDKYNLTYFKGILEIIYANMKYSMGDYEEAQKYCLSANSIFLRNDNIEYTVKSFLLLGYIALKMGHTNTALNYFMQGDSILNENNYLGEFLKANVYYNISECYSKMNDTQKAIEYAFIAEERLLELNNKKEYAEKLMLLSISLSENNKIVEALNYAKKAKKVFSELRDIHEKANIETNLGAIFAKGSKLEEAFMHFENAVKLKNEISDSTLPDTLLKMCETFIEFNEFDKALEAVNKAQNIIGIDQHLYRIECYEQLFNIYNKKGDRSNAEGILLKGIGYLEKLDYKKQLGDFYSLLGKFYIESNQKELALSYISKGIDLYKELKIILCD